MFRQLSIGQPWARLISRCKTTSTSKIVDSIPAKSNRAIVVPAVKREFFVRLVPLSKGGLPANPDWRNPKEPVLKPKFEKRDIKTKNLTSSWTWPSDLRLRIDGGHTPVQIVQHLINTVDELQHLRSLTADQLVNFVSMTHFDQQIDFLNDREGNNPIDFKSIHYYYECIQTKWDSTVCVPTLLVVAFAQTVDHRLLQPLPRDDTKPLLWLDVDGVVNGSVGNDEKHVVDCCAGECWPIGFSPQIVRELNRLSTVCDVFWSTAWGKWARLRLAPAIGLDDFKVWPRWKGSMDDVVNFDRPLIWIDDNLDEKSCGRFKRDMVDAVKAKFKHHLLIGPRVRESNSREYGLTMRHIEQIDAFLAKHSNTAKEGGSAG